MPIVHNRELSFFEPELPCHFRGILGPDRIEHADALARFGQDHIHRQLTHDAHWPRRLLAEPFAREPLLAGCEVGAVAFQANFDVGACYDARCLVVRTQFNWFVGIAADERVEFDVAEHLEEVVDFAKGLRRATCWEGTTVRLGGSVLSIG